MRRKVIRAKKKICDLNIVDKAIQVAVIAHAGQVRKGDGLPYIIHPISVAAKLSRYGFSEHIVAAGYVHDVLEDTDYPPGRLKKELGSRVFDIVKAVTNDDSLSWEEKKEKYVKTVRKGSIGAKAVALVDKIQNIESLISAYNAQGPSIWKKFNRGKTKKLWFESMVLNMLKQSWDHPLIIEYERLIKRVVKLRE